jgi:hypothetical protein
VCTTKKTPYFTITKIKWLILFKEVTGVYSKVHMKPIMQNEELFIIEAGGTIQL